VITFGIDFEFSSAFYSRIAGLFFDEVARSTLTAFNRRCGEIYGPPAGIQQPKAGHRP